MCHLICWAAKRWGLKSEESKAINEGRLIHQWQQTTDIIPLKKLKYKILRIRKTEKYITYISPSNVHELHQETKKHGTVNKYAFTRRASSNIRVGSTTPRISSPARDNGFFWLETTVMSTYSISFTHYQYQCVNLHSASSVDPRNGARCASTVWTEVFSTHLTTASVEFGLWTGSEKLLHVDGPAMAKAGGCTCQVSATVGM